MESEGVTLSYISAKKVYIMVLDEGTFFNPMAVHLLIDRMKKHPTPEAVCGRIHPCGAGCVCIMISKNQHTLLF